MTRRNKLFKKLFDFLTQKKKKKKKEKKKKASMLWPSQNFSYKSNTLT